MQIERDLRVFLHANKLTPNMGFFLISTYNDDDKYLKTITVEERRDLGRRNLIFDGEKPMLRAEGLKLFEDENMKLLFDELWEYYPFKTIGGRVLRSRDKNTKNYNDAWSIYRRYVKKKEVHNNVIGGLKAELNDRTSGNSLNYMTNILTYLRNRGWEMYDSDGVDLKTDSLYSTI